MAIAEYTEEQVSEHNSKDDLWLIIHDGVYDVTKYLTEHPGGELILMQAAGTDATEEFEDNGHSEDARKLMADFKIGIVKGTAKPSCKCWFANHLKSTLLIGSLVIVAAVVYRCKFASN